MLFNFFKKKDKTLIDVNVALPVLKNVGAGDKYRRSKEVLVFTKSGYYHFAQYCENKSYEPAAKFWRCEDGNLTVNDVIGWLPTSDLPKMPRN